MRRAIQMIILAILLFACIGLGYQLIFNPVGLLRRFLLIVLIGALLFLLFRWFMSNRYGVPLFPKRQGPSRSQLRRAKQTSTVKANSSSLQQAPSKRNPRQANKHAAHKSSPPKKKREHNFTVIEGKKNKKGKKKNQA